MYAKPGTILHEWVWFCTKDNARCCWEAFLFLFSPFFFKILFIYGAEWESTNRVEALGKGRASSLLNKEPNAGLVPRLWNHVLSQRQTLHQLSHPGGPGHCFLRYDTKILTNERTNWSTGLYHNLKHWCFRRHWWENPSHVTHREKLGVISIPAEGLLREHWMNAQKSEWKKSSKESQLSYGFSLICGA